MKDDIKTDPTNQQNQTNRPGQIPQKSVDGINPPSQTRQDFNVKTDPNKPAQPEPNAQNKQVESTPEQPKADQQESTQTAKKPAKNINIWPIITAVVILLIFSSLAVYAGLIKDDEPGDSAKNTNALSDQQTQDQKAADDQALQDTIKQIDDLPENKDTSGDNLTDSQLGL